MSEEKPDRKIKITVDNEQTKILAEELARERLKNDMLVDRIAGNEVKEDKDDLATKKLQAFEKFHQERFLEAENVEQLRDMITAHINTIAERSKGSPSGSAPLNDSQMGKSKENLFTKPYSSHGEMIEDLQKKSAEGNVEAKEYLTALLKKWVLDKRSNPTRPEPSFSPNTPEALLELGLVEKDGFLTPANPEDGDLGKLQKKWRMERKRRMEGNNQ